MWYIHFIYILQHDSLNLFALVVYCRHVLFFVLGVPLNYIFNAHVLNTRARYLKVLAVANQVQLSLAWQKY